VDEQNEFNRRADEALYDERGYSREPDLYPDGDEAQRVLAHWQEAEALGMDPATLDLLDSGHLEL